MSEPSRDDARWALRRKALHYDPDDRQRRAMALTVIVRTAPWEPGPDGIVPQIINRLQIHADEVAESAVERLIEAIVDPTDPRILDIMQDALVRAGRLTESREMETFFDGFDQIVRETARARYVTDWREVEP